VNAMTPITLSRQRHGLLADCLSDRVEPVARSARFTVYHLDPDWPAHTTALDPDDVIVVHDFTPAEIDNNIGRHVADELLPLLGGAPPSRAGNGAAANVQALFEHFVGDIVRSMDGSERRAWHLFYDNTLAALVRTGPQTNGAAAGEPTLQDFIGDFAAIYRRVAHLSAKVAPASLLDVATCFGFLPLLLASGAWAHVFGDRRPRRIVACDLNPALVSLAEGYARERQLSGVRFVLADILAADAARALALPEASYDIVTAIHLLEHLEPAETAAAMDALWALARRRLIVTVPVEEVPDPRFGHRQVFDRRSLGALGDRTDGTCRCFEDHGIWLVIDRKGDAGVSAEDRA